MRIGELCTREVVYCERSTGVLEVAQLMRDHHVGDLVVKVLADGVLVGVLTADDITGFLAEELTGVARIAPRQAVLEKTTLLPVKH